MHNFLCKCKFSLLGFGVKESFALMAFLIVFLMFWMRMWGNLISLLVTLEISDAFTSKCKINYSGVSSSAVFGTLFGNHVLISWLVGFGLICWLDGFQVEAGLGDEVVDLNYNFSNVMSESSGEESSHEDEPKKLLWSFIFFFLAVIHVRWTAWTAHPCPGLGGLKPLGVLSFWLHNKGEWAKYI